MAPGPGGGGGGGTDPPPKLACVGGANVCTEGWWLTCGGGCGAY